MTVENYLKLFMIGLMNLKSGMKNKIMLIILKKSQNFHKRRLRNIWKKVFFNVLEGIK